MRGLFTDFLLVYRFCHSDIEREKETGKIYAGLFVKYAETTLDGRRKPRLSSRRSNRHFGTAHYTASHFASAITTTSYIPAISLIRWHMSFILHDAAISAVLRHCPIPRRIIGRDASIRLSAARHTLPDTTDVRHGLVSTPRDTSRRRILQVARDADTDCLPISGY